MMMTHSPQDMPLAGIKVLDLSAYIAGPYGCTLLADLGADVIKVEAPEGDNLRRYPSTIPNESRAFIGVNRGKRGIVLDLKSADDYESLCALVCEADVLVHNFRPSVPPRLKIDYSTLSVMNSRLIYCALTGYGDTGPLADKAGYDQVLQSRTGICTAQGTPENPEIVYGSVVDYYAASMLCSSVCAALFQRERTGRGNCISVSLLGSALTMQSARLVMTENEPKKINRDMRSGGITGIHPTSEGHLYISANTPHFWEALCELIGLPELASNEKYNSVRKRAEHAHEIIPMIRRSLMAKTAQQWEMHFGTTVPCAAVRPIEDMFEDPQVLSQGFIQSMNHPVIGQYKGFAKPFRFSGCQTECELRSAPMLGQHNNEVLGVLSKMKKGDKQ